MTQNTPKYWENKTTDIAALAAQVKELAAKVDAFAQMQNDTIKLLKSFKKGK